VIFDYPQSRSERVHGPAGYASYESFRPWLRDEFTFRCVYCLKRETWGQVTGEFELDHFKPQSLAPNLSLDYFNLVYACRRCNSVKLDQSVDDPLVEFSSESIVVLPDGVVASDLPQTKRLIQQLDLNSPKLKRWRVMCTSDSQDFRKTCRISGGCDRQVTPVAMASKSVGMRNDSEANSRRPTDGRSAGRSWRKSIHFVDFRVTLCDRSRTQRSGAHLPASTGHIDRCLRSIGE